MSDTSSDRDSPTFDNEKASLPDSVSNYGDDIGDAPPVRMLFDSCTYRAKFRLPSSMTLVRVCGSARGEYCQRVHRLDNDVGPVGYYSTRKTGTYIDGFLHVDRRPPGPHGGGNGSTCD
jgi:hypothetical protein